MRTFPFRSSCPEVFYKKGVLRNFAKFIGKHLCQSLFFNKVAGLGPATLLKKRLWYRCFPLNIAKFLKTPFLTKHLRWLLLSFGKNDKHIPRKMSLYFLKGFYFRCLLGHARVLFFYNRLKVNLNTAR